MRVLWHKAGDVVQTEYVNFFIISVCRIMEEMCMIHFKAGKPIPKKDRYLPDSLVVSIDFSSGLTGRLVLNINHNMALRIISKMIQETDDTVYTIDELGQSAVCELCNMIASNAITMCTNNSDNISVVYITPPLYCTGKQYKDNDSEMLSIPFFSEIGSFSVDIFL